MNITNTFQTLPDEHLPTNLIPLSNYTQYQLIFKIIN